MVLELEVSKLKQCNWDLIGASKLYRSHNHSIQAKNNCINTTEWEWMKNRGFFFPSIQSIYIWLL